MIDEDEDTVNSLLRIINDHERLLKALTYSKNQKDILETELKALEKEESILANKKEKCSQSIKKNKDAIKLCEFMLTCSKSEQLPSTKPSTPAPPPPVPSSTKQQPVPVPSSTKQQPVPAPSIQQSLPPPVPSSIQQQPPPVPSIQQPTTLPAPSSTRRPVTLSVFLAVHPSKTRVQPVFLAFFLNLASEPSCICPAKL